MRFRDRDLDEEQRQQSVNILASRNSVANGVAAVGVSNINGLVEEDNGSICVP